MSYRLAFLYEFMARETMLLSTIRHCITAHINCLLHARDANGYVPRGGNGCRVEVLIFESQFTTCFNPYGSLTRKHRRDKQAVAPINSVLPQFHIMQFHIMCYKCIAVGESAQL